MLNKDVDNLWYGIWGFGISEVFSLDWTLAEISDVTGVKAYGRLGVDNVDGWVPLFLFIIFPSISKSV